MKKRDELLFNNIGDIRKTVLSPSSSNCRRNQIPELLGKAPQQFEHDPTSKGQHTTDFPNIRASLDDFPLYGQHNGFSHLAHWYSIVKTQGSNTLVFMHHNHP